MESLIVSCRVEGNPRETATIGYELINKARQAQPVGDVKGDW